MLRLFFCNNRNTRTFKMESLARLRILKIRNGELPRKDFIKISFSRLWQEKTNFKLSNLSLNRNFSTNKGNDSKVIKPEVIYKNADTQKIEIFRDNKGKSGIYRWTNNLNGDSYIGSAIDLNKRLYQYYSLKLMELYLQKRKSYIYSAVIKYGYSNFTLEIIEYCDKLKVVESFFWNLDPPLGGGPPCGDLGFKKKRRKLENSFILIYYVQNITFYRLQAHVSVLNIRMRLEKKCLYLK